MKRRRKVIENLEDGICLHVDNLSKRYKGFELDNISFDVPKGMIMGLIGENGAGKTTTIHAILDLIQKDSGNVTFWGNKLSENTRDLKEDIGVVFDEICFYGTLTPEKVGKISEAAYKQWDENVYRAHLNKFKLPLNKPIKTFSKGMKMMLSLAVALSHNPKILILDEATSGLDPSIREDMLDVFLTFVQDENHAVLISSHMTTDLEKIADYITFIHEGKVLFCKSKDTLRYEYGIMRCSEERFETVKSGEILAYRKNGYQIDAIVKDKAKIKRTFPDIIVDDATIEDIFLIYVKGEYKI
jgi:ABC-2 type transport system ATP-binding protein